MTQHPHPDATVELERSSLERAYRRLYADTLTLRDIAADRVCTDRPAHESPSPIHFPDWAGLR